MSLICYRRRRRDCRRYCIVSHHLSLSLSLCLSLSLSLSFFSACLRRFCAGVVRGMRCVLSYRLLTRAALYIF